MPNPSKRSKAGSSNYVEKIEINPLPNKPNLKEAFTQTTDYFSNYYVLVSKLISSDHFGNLIFIFFGIKCTVKPQNSMSA
ncbi:unnamed protein product [Brachionus calyciflorus]|uniref:Uncharacterized protein n=1 Tax=Brachionus calyciflorus TaxID=104777 RepID=A0A813XHI2_9BILA|nr:unnamed protein product [Brachionus calyciflorus]